MAAAAGGTSSGDHFAGGRGAGGDSGCSTPFVSAPSSPARDLSFHLAAAGCFFSAPASPSRGAGDCDYEEFDFDFSSRFPSPAAAAMSSADELFHDGQIRPMRLSSFLLRPQALPPRADHPAGHPLPPLEAAAPADERGRFRSRSVHRRSRSLSPFRTHWMSPSSSSPAPAKESGETPTSASRSSSSSSMASSASSTSSTRSHRRWWFLKDLVHRSKSDGSKRPPRPSPPPPSATPKRNPSPAAARGRAGRRSAHERLYEARRAEAEEMRRRTFLPYRQWLLLGCLGLGSRGYGAMHGLAVAAKSRA